MTDLIDRLKNHGESDDGSLPYNGDADLMNEAVSHIVELRRLLARYLDERPIGYQRDIIAREAERVLGRI